MRVPLAGLFVGAVLAAGGCEGDPHALTWRFVFEDETLRARAVAIEAEVREGGCTGPTLYDGEVTRTMTPAAPRTLAKGTYGLSGRARDSACTRFAAGCGVVELPSSGEVVITLEASLEDPACERDDCADGVCVGGTPDAGMTPDARIPIPDGCVPTTESCDESDEDCDGLVDEDFDLASDAANCGECGVSCGAGTCLGGSCGPGPNEVAEVGAGGDFSCARMGSGAVYCWGKNEHGQLGDPAAMDSPTPVRAVAIADAVHMTLGGQHVCVVRADRTVACWGGDGGGQLGDGGMGDTATPVTALGLDSVTAIQAGGFHNCAIREGSDLVCWGFNGQGQLGVGDTTVRSVPTPVPGMTGIAQIAANNESTCVLDSAGAVFCFGRNDFGQAGDGTIGGNRPDAVRVMGLPMAKAVGCGVGHACAVLTDGAVQCWGHGAFGALGDGTSIDRGSPAPVAGLRDAVEVYGGNEHTCALRETGAVVCWGNNGYGQLGDGTTSSRQAPGAAVTGVNALGLGILHQHNCALDTDRTVLCWGRNDFDQIGPGGVGTLDVTMAQPVTGLP